MNEDFLVEPASIGDRRGHGVQIPSSGYGVVWTAIAVAVVLAGFVVTRVIEEI